MLLGAMIKFGAGERLPSDQTDRKFEAPSLVRQRDPVVAEKRTMAARFSEIKSARQSREGIYSSSNTCSTTRRIAQDLRLAAQHQRGAIEFGVGSCELRLELLNPARPDPTANQMKDGGDRRQQHQRQNDEAGDIGLDRRHVEREPRRRLQGPGEVLRARRRACKQIKRRARRGSGGNRPVEPSRPPADLEALRPAEPPQRIASSRA